MKNQKDTINLGKNKDTIHLIYTYRIEKFLERASHRDKTFENLEPLFLEKYKTLEELKNAFIDLVLNSTNISDEFFHSKELNERSTLFRILRSKGILEETIAELSFRQMNIGKEINKGRIIELSTHLKYCLAHPEIMKQYKEYSI